MILSTPYSVADLRLALLALSTIIAVVLLVEGRQEHPQVLYRFLPVSGAFKPLINAPLAYASSPYAEAGIALISTAVLLNVLQNFMSTYFSIFQQKSGALLPGVTLFSW